jgi:glycosyltransferase involved in cell wall biosynthesis
LEQTFNEIPFDIVDDVILVDDSSTDKTVELARKLNIHHVIQHDHNRGYGGNQKTCYNKALELKADIVVMLHPDYQYTPKLITAMCSIIANEVYPVVFASRILGKGAINGGMPIYKYIANRILTFIQNVLINQKLSEYHTGFRAYSAEVLHKVNYNDFSEDFIFDNQMAVQIFKKGCEIGEISCPTKYFPEASSINFEKSLVYGTGVLKESFSYLYSRKN